MQQDAAQARRLPPIAFSHPDLGDRERAYLLEAFDSSWISSLGPFVSQFETAFAAWTGTRHAMTCSNGTVALHLAMLSLDLGPGDEVIVPSMTYVATANAVTYVGAQPVFTDCDAKTWTITPEIVERLITPRTRAVVAVHLFGVPCDVNALRAVTEPRGIAIIEDAAEAHGATLAGHMVGHLGDIAAFSFYGNKIITTGEGGMVCTNRDDLAARVRTFRAQGSDPRQTYWFPQIGYNYRLTNLASAIGLAQLERVEEITAARRDVTEYYDRAIADRGLPLETQALPPDATRSSWTYGVVTGASDGPPATHVRQVLADAGIETRPFFHPLHTLPMYRTAPRGDMPESERLARHGVLLPMHTKLTQANRLRICDALESALTARTATCSVPRDTLGPTPVATSAPRREHVAP